MKNKTVAFDYLHDTLLVNRNANLQAQDDTRLEDADKTELIKLTNAIKSISDKASKFDLLQTEEGNKMQIEQFKLQKKTQELASLNMENTYDTIMSIKSSLQNVVQGATRAYNYIMAMYIAAFVLGIGLVVTAIYFAAQDKMILAAAFGTVGFLDLVTTFFFKPPTEIQNSRSNLAQLMIIITNWFAETMNLNSYMAQKGSEITLDDMKEISSTLNDSTAKMVKLIEKYSENRSSKKE